MRKRLSLLLLAATLCTGIAPALAQGKALQVGQPVKATMTSTEFEFEYTFTGAAGDVVVAEMRAVDPYGNLNEPVLQLLDANRRVLADTTNAFSFSSALLAAELPANGNYVLVATRVNGRTGESAGEFSLELIAPAPLMADAPIKGSASSEGRSQYFLVRPTGAFQVDYRKIGGDLIAEVSVNRINPDDGGLREIAIISGEELTKGSLGEFPPGAVYIVSVGKARYSFSLDETAVDFELSVSAPE